jgi:hypothetical protein
MSIIFFDGFDYATAAAYGPGGRHWDQGSTGGPLIPGRFGGQGLNPGSAIVGDAWSGASHTFGFNTSEVIFGTAIRVSSVVPIHPFVIFWDGNTPQCSLWIDPTTFTITMRTGRGTLITDTTLGDSGFVPPLTLWFYLEVKVQIGNPGSFEIKVNGTVEGTFTGVQTQQTGNAYTNKIGVMGVLTFAVGQVVFDDMYLINTQDATNNVDYLGEVRVQTMYPDAEGYEDDFLPSTGVNYQNVNTPVIDYTTGGNFNYSGTVGALDAYTIGTFTISGTIFAVQENISFRKDDVGNRAINPLMRTASTNYLGSTFPCYSDFTYAGAMWEINPNTGIPWILTDLNAAQFGIKVAS